MAGRFVNIQSFPVGTIVPFTSVTSLSGWLVCDGSAIDRIIYSELFALLSTTHGQGNGTTTFNIPDYRGRFLRGLDAGTGRDPNAGARAAMNTGGNINNNLGSVQGSDYSSHNHQWSWVSTAGNLPLSSSNYWGSQGTGNSVAAYWSWGGYSATGNTTMTTLVASSGGNENRPLNAAVNFLIRY